MDTSMEALQRGALAPDITLPNQDGEEISFSSLWSREGTHGTVFVFLRHFG